MCLIKGQNEPYIAKEDIIVYKAIKKVGDEYFTYFQEYPVELNSLLIPEPIKGNVLIKYTGYYNIIEEGMIHSYTNNFYKDFINLEKIWVLYKDLVLVKAIIKKGTKFYIDISEKEIASESLYITDEFINLNDECKQTDLSEYVN